MNANQSSLRSHSLELLVQYQQQPTVALRNKLVRLNAGLVRKIAHRVSQQCLEPYEDLEQVGYMGLIRAVERFNPSQGCAFSSFAVPYIRGEMLHYLRDRSAAVKVPRRLQEMQKEACRLQQDMTRTLGREPSEAEMVDVMNISVQEWRELKISLKNRSPLSLDALVSQQMDSPMTLGDLLPDQYLQNLQNLEEERQVIQGALAQLEEKTRDAIEYVFFKGMSRKEVAKQIGVSPMTVSRRIQRGLDQMVAYLQPQTLRTEP